MDTEFEKSLVEALELISITANQAWWNTRQHCGSDFNIPYCQDCFAYDQCQHNEKLKALFKALHAAVE